MCWCRSFSAICPAFFLDSGLEEIPPNFISYPRTVLLPEKSQKFPLFSILEVSISLLFNCRLWLFFCDTQGLGFCLYRVSAKMLSLICPPKCYSVCWLFHSYYLLTQCLEQSMAPASQAAIIPRLREKAPCTPCNPRPEQLWPPRSIVGTTEMLGSLQLVLGSVLYNMSLSVFHQL